MATSQNGWPAYTSGTHPDLVAIPHVAGRVRRGDVATIFTYLINRFDREVESVAEAAGQPEDDWGWASRPIRGKTTDLSNHASGTAIDLNAPRHPLGKVGTFTPAQVRGIRSILTALGGAVRWGGDYPGRKDEMHFEINANAQRVAQVAAAIRGGQLVSNPSGGTGSITAPTFPGAPAPITPEDDMNKDQDAALARVLRIAEGLEDYLLEPNGRGNQADSRILGVLRSRRGTDGNVWSVLDEGDGGEIVRQVQAANARAVAETSSAFHQLVALINGKPGATELDPDLFADAVVEAVGTDLAERFVDALGARLTPKG